MKPAVILISLVLLGLFGWYLYGNLASDPVETEMTENLTGGGIIDAPEPTAPYPLSIESLRSGSYPGSDLTVIEKLADKLSYTQSVVSYESEGNSIRALLTVPKGKKPDSGWPVVIFNHGYIPPREYRTTGRYTAYVDYFARNGYLVFKSDYRGHGLSDGIASGGYGSNAYTIDVLNAVSSVKTLPEADAGRIGMWGHSMGGHITLRVMVTTQDVKAGVIWAGVVASYPDLLTSWRRRNTTPPAALPTGARRWREELVAKFGAPEKNPEFWDSISATAYLSDISGPLELHHAKGDASVPYEFSETLKTKLDEVGESANLFIYEGDDHNISVNFSAAMKRSLEFFNKHLQPRLPEQAKDPASEIP